MERYELQQLRQLPIEAVAERLGLQTERHKSLCPFHDDHHPSLTFDTRRNTFRCFACGEHGGTIDLAMRLLHTDFKEACRWLAGGTEAYHQPLPSQPIKGETSQLHSTFDPAKYERFFLHPWLSKEARRFLFDERRLDPRVVRWCRLTSWRDHQGICWLQTPYYDADGKLMGVQWRNLRPSKSPLKGDLPCPPPLRGNEGVFLRGNEGVPRFRFPYGSRCGIYNLPILNRLRPHEDLYITEGCSDCWAMLSAGHKAIAIPSATLLSPKDKETLSTLSSQLSTKFHIYPDNDAPGEQLFLQLAEILPDIQRHTLPVGCKDFSDYYVQLKSTINYG